MGCGPSRYVGDEYTRYDILDERDRDDFDDCCGCGPWYGGRDYRWMRRQYLPGCGSPPGNYYGLGGYAGIYPSVQERIAAVPSQPVVLPIQPQVAVAPYQSQLAAPYQSGYIASNECYPNRRIGMW